MNDSDQRATEAGSEAEAAEPTPRRPRVIAVMCQKGGVAKTTTATNLAVMLAAIGRRVLLIDMDSQGNATTTLGDSARAPVGGFDLLVGRATFEEVRHATPYPGLWLVPATEDLAAVDIRFAKVQRPQSVLRRQLAAAPSDLDYVVIDCPPSLGLVSLNALVASDAAIVPIQTEPFAHDGMTRVFHNINRVKENLNPGLAVHGLLPTLVRPGEAGRAMAESFRREFGDQVYHTAVPYDPRVVDAAARDLPSVVFDPDSPAAAAYMAFFVEFLEREHVLAARAARRDQKAGRPVPDVPPTPDSELPGHLKQVLDSWHMARIRDRPAEKVPPRQPRAEAGADSGPADPLGWTGSSALGGENAPAPATARGRPLVTFLAFVLMFALGFAAGIAFITMAGDALKL